MADIEDKEFRKQLRSLIYDAESYKEVRTSISELITEIRNTKGSIKKKDLIRKLHDCIPPRELF